MKGIGLPEKKGQEQRDKANCTHTITHIEIGHQRLLEIPGSSDPDPKGDQHKRQRHEETKARFLLHKDDCVVQADDETDDAAEGTHYRL